MKTLPEKIKEARCELGMTQSELGEAVGVSLRSILSYEKGEKYPRLSTMLKLGAALGVSTRFLTDDGCEDPLCDIEKDGYITEARSRVGMGVNVNELIEANNALFAGGDLTQEQKDEYFQAVMTAYVMCKDAAKNKFGEK